MDDRGRRGVAVAHEPDVVVQTSGLTKRFGRTVALRDVDLEVRRGEVLGYLGPNGAGKTTTLRILMGFLRPTAGAAWIHGRDTWREAAAVHRTSATCLGSRPCTTG